MPISNKLIYQYVSHTIGMVVDPSTLTRLWLMPVIDRQRQRHVWRCRQFSPPLLESTWNECSFCAAVDRRTPSLRGDSRKLSLYSRLVHIAWHTLIAGCCAYAVAMVTDNVITACGWRVVQLSCACSYSCTQTLVCAVVTRIHLICL